MAGRLPHRGAPRISRPLGVRPGCVMAKYIASVTIRNMRRVYSDGTTFIVAHIDSRGVEHTYGLPSPAVDRLYALTQGETLTKDEAADRLEPFADQLHLTYQYGWKLSFLVLEMLVVLVALGKATIAKRGNSYYFAVH